jgi:hypothetical protein
MTQAASQPAPLRVGDLLKLVKFSDEARPLLEGPESLEEAFQLLLDKGLYTDTLRFAAYSLPKAEAVWWGALCAWHVYRPQPDPKITAALSAAVRWVAHQDEAHRRAAEGAAQAVGTQTPAGMVALAAFFSGGSIAPAEQTAPVAPDPYLTAKTISGAVLMLSNLVKPDQVRACRWRFTELAAEVASDRLGLRIQTCAQPRSGSPAHQAARHG